MNEPVEIVFALVGGNKISFLIKGRHYPDDKDYWHVNWMLVDVAIQVGAFSGKVSGEFRNEHFHNFYQELALLHKTLKGTATFHVDQRVTMNVAALRTGHIRIYGSMNDEHDANTLNFSIETEHTYLSTPLKQIQKNVELYPVLYQKPITKNE